MSNDSIEEESDDLALSRLDIVSCGLGGAILLCLIFSIIRSSPPIVASAPPFINATFIVKDPQVLLNVYLKPPGEAGFEIPLEDFNLAIGRLKPPTERKRNIPLTPPEDIYLLGFSRHGHDAMLLANQTGERRFVVVIERPRPGRWQVEARYQNRADIDKWFAAGKPIAADIGRTVVLRDRSLPPLETVVQWGNQSDFDGLQKLPIQINDGTRTTP